MKNFFSLSLVALAALLPLNASAAPLIEAPFEGTTLAAGWQTHGTPAASAKLADGTLVLDVNSAKNQFRSLLTRRSDDAGRDTFGKAATFDFYDHPLTVNADVGALGGRASAGGAIWYCIGVGSDEQGARLYPVAATNGLFVAVKRIQVGENLKFDQLWSIQKVGGVKTDKVLGNLNGTLTGLDIEMAANVWTVTLRGAKVGGESSVEANFSGIGQSDFADFQLVAGVWNSGADVGQSGSLVLRKLQVSTTAEPKN